MQDSRRATIYPTTQGWYLELPEHGGDAQDVYTYGPVSTAFEANWYLRTIANPAGVAVERDLRAIPTSSPNGHPVTGIRQPAQAPAFGEDASRFITHADLLSTFVYDSLCDIGYEVDGNRIAAIRPGVFWDPQTQQLSGTALPGTDADWKTLSRATAAGLLKEGRTYAPVSVPGLPFRPALPERVREWATI